MQFLKSDQVQHQWSYLVYVPLKSIYVFPSPVKWKFLFHHAREKVKIVWRSFSLGSAWEEQRGKPATPPSTQQLSSLLAKLQR